jgi:ketosteroid isomerase-like protein
VTQEASPTASPTALSPLLQQWVDGVVAGDGDAIAALSIEDAVHKDVPASMVVQRPEEIAALVTGSVTQFKAANGVRLTNRVPPG